MRAYFIILFFVLFAAPGYAEKPALEMTMLDTGYADAFLVKSPDGKNILLDSGDVKKPDLVVDFLKQKNVSRLDLVIISHPHKNHFGALFRVLDEIQIKEIAWNGDSRQEDPFPELLEKISGKKIPVRVLKAGDRLDISKDLNFLAFHPSGEMTDNINNNALVLKMTFGKKSALFTTDIGYGIQNDLIKKYGRKLKADVVQIPHHGGPISEKFIDFFKPEFFILSTGPNEWGLPREDQVSKLKSPVLRTDRNGTIVFRSDGNKIWKI